MSQTFFSKQDAAEKQNRLSGIANIRGEVTLWIKGSKDKQVHTVTDFDKERTALVLTTKETLFPVNTRVLCSFMYRGMNFFAEVIYQKSIGGFGLIAFTGDFYKSERRNSFRLMTFPQYEVWAEINLGEAYQGGKVVGLKNRISQTGIFKNFLKLMNEDTTEGNEAETGLLKVRLQDLSVTGMALHIGELEKEYLQKDSIYHDVTLRFSDEVITIPKMKVMYLAPYIGSDRNLKQYKVGIRFEELPTITDEALGKKINQLLRESDHNKDFETFIK